MELFKNSNKKTLSHNRETKSNLMAVWEIYETVRVKLYIAD